MILTYNGEYNILAKLQYRLFPCSLKFCKCLHLSLPSIWFRPVGHPTFITTYYLISYFFLFHLFTYSSWYIFLSLHMHCSLHNITWYNSCLDTIFILSILITLHICLSIFISTRLVVCCSFVHDQKFQYTFLIIPNISILLPHNIPYRGTNLQRCSISYEGSYSYMINSTITNVLVHLDTITVTTATTRFSGVRILLVFILKVEHVFTKLFTMFIHILIV